MTSASSIHLKAPKQKQKSCKKQKQKHSSDFRQNLALKSLLIVSILNKHSDSSDFSLSWKHQQTSTKNISNQSAPVQA
jgi:hypothetical protein